MATTMTGSRGFGSASGLMSGKTPSGYKQASIANFTPEQMGLFKQLFSNVGPESPLARLASGDESQFAALEEPALRQFSGLQGQLASRFSGMGLGGRLGSGFKQASTSAASDFASQLQSQRLGLQQQALRDLMGMSESLLGQRPYEQFLVPKQKSFWEELLTGAAPGIAQTGSQMGGLALLKKLGLF